LKALNASLIFFESPQRLAQSLADLAEVLGDRPAAAGRELTKLHEEMRRGRLASLAAHYAKAGAPKGEVTLVIGPPEKEMPDLSRADALLARALTFMPVRAAADLVAEALGLSRRTVYGRALALKQDHD
jgi:16S rRNA (cytidine1402-2'-O)-methyltransferase